MMSRDRKIEDDELDRELLSEDAVLPAGELQELRASQLARAQRAMLDMSTGYRMDPDDVTLLYDYDQLLTVGQDFLRRFKDKRREMYQAYGPYYKSLTASVQRFRPFGNLIDRLRR